MGWFLSIGVLLPRFHCLSGPVQGNMRRPLGRWPISGHRTLGKAIVTSYPEWDRVGDVSQQHHSPLSKNHLPILVNGVGGLIYGQRRALRLGEKHLSPLLLGSSLRGTKT